MDAADEHLLRTLAPQVLGVIVRRYGDFAAAEDAVQEALLAASLQWPAEGVPENPRGWLIQVAARRMLAVCPGPALVVHRACHLGHAPRPHNPALGGPSQLDRLVLPAHWRELHRCVAREPA